MLRIRLQSASCRKLHSLLSRRTTAAAATATPFTSARFASNDEGSRYEQGVAQSRAAPAPPSPAAAGGAPASSDDSGAFTKNRVWGLWNEGNLFSMSVDELAAFLRAHSTEPIEKGARKSALVRRVEEMMAAEQPTLVNAETDTAPPAEDEYAAKGVDLLDEADMYGDWGADHGFESRRGLDFLEVSRDAIVDSRQSKKGYLGPRAFQLLHNEATADVGLGRFDPSKLPGCSGMKSSLCSVMVPSEEANKVRFRRAFKWCATNLWNMNLDGEINVGAGKALYWRGVAKHNKNVLPLWTVQAHLKNTHPYTWFAVAHETNVTDAERLAGQLGMTLTQEPETSYKVMVRRPRGDVLDVELNAQLQCTLVNRPWDRILCTHMLRAKMPDLRFLVRARVPLKQRFTDAYFETQLLRMTQDSVQSLLQPDLGTVEYTCERTIRKWTTELAAGGKLQLVETKRTPLIITRQGDEGERIEYELIAQMPQQAERVDLHALANEIWGRSTEFATALEDGMTELHAHTMSQAAAFH